METNTAILGLIRGAETSRGYDDYSRYATMAPPKQVTQMTVNEIKQWQRDAARRGSKSVAVGGYQMITKTFNATVRDMGLTGDEIFDADLQDRMGMHLLNGRGYNKWINGQMTDDHFMDNLSMEWAALPRATGPKRGRSHYDKDGLNASRVGLDVVSQALEAGRTGAEWEFPGGTPSGGGRTFTPAEQERQIKLASLSADDSYTGADTSKVTSTGFFRTQQDDAKAAEAGGVSFWDGLSMAIDETWISHQAARQLGRESYSVDKDFVLTDEIWGNLTADIPSQYHDVFNDAVSLDHAKSLREETMRFVELDQKMASLGWTGTGLRVGAALLDPAAIGISMVTEGSAAPFIYGAKIGRLGRFLRGGAAASAVNAGIESYIVSQNPLMDYENVGYAAAAGFVLGGAFSALGRSSTDQKLADAMEKVLDGVDTPMGTALPSQLSPDGSLSAARAEPIDPNLSVSEQVALASQDAARTVDTVGELVPALKNVPVVKDVKTRIDMVGRLKSSESGIVRRVAGLLGEDAVGNVDDSVVTRAASENLARDMRVTGARFYRVYNEAFSNWAKSQDLSWFKRNGPAARLQFNEAVGIAVRREIDDALDPNVRAVAQQVKTQYADLLQWAKENNVRGFDNIAEKSNYLTRKHRVERLDELIERHGEGTINQLVARSMVKQNQKLRNQNAARAMGEPELDYEDALKLGAAYVKSIRSRRYGSFDHMQAFSGADGDLLEELLLDTGMKADDVAGIRSRVEGRKDTSQEGRLGVARMRLDLDETFSMDRIMPDGSTETLRIEDFLNNDIEAVFNDYARGVFGAGHIEQAFGTLKVALPDGTMPRHAPSWETIKGYIRDEAQRLNMSTNQLNGELRKLETLYKGVKGIPQQEHFRRHDWMRRLRDYNFVRIGGQLGIAQLAEIGNVLGNAGVTGMVRHMPALRSIFQTARSGGTFSDDMFNEIEAIWGFGTDLTRQSPHVRPDDLSGGTFESRSGDITNGQKVDFLLAQGKKATSIGSGMAHINMTLQRMNARVLVQRFMDDANGTRGINPRRMAVMGISEDMQKRIQAQMSQHVDQVEGLIGRKVSRINIEKWDDLDAKNAFINGVDRWSKKSVQENDIGNMPEFMTGELGKTIMQFRSFMVAAYTKQLLAGVNARDWEAFSAAMTSMFFGGLFYAGQQVLNAQGRPDKKEWLEERLSTSSIGKAAFQRAAFSSFIPMGVDFVWGFGGGEPVFDYRSSGLRSGGGGLMNSLLSNPTADLIQRAQQAGQGVTASFLNPDYDFSQRDWRALSSTLFFQNAFILRNGLQMMGSGLPRYSY